MVKLGFGRRWINWVLNCVCSASMSILLNGTPLKPFKMEKGLRQGDPLSPYLFILVTEALVCLLNKANSLHLIEPLLIGKDKVRLNLLQFADDTLFFVPNNPVYIMNYFRVLDIFPVMSGLSLNYSKSTFITWNSGDSCCCIPTILPKTSVLCVPHQPSRALSQPLLEYFLRPPPPNH